MSFPFHNVPIWHILCVEEEERKGRSVRWHFDMAQVGGWGLSMRHKVFSRILSDHQVSCVSSGGKFAVLYIEAFLSESQCEVIHNSQIPYSWWELLWLSGCMKCTTDTECMTDSAAQCLSLSCGMRPTVSIVPNGCENYGHTNHAQFLCHCIYHNANPQKTHLGWSYAPAYCWFPKLAL